MLKPIMPTFRRAHALLIEGDIANRPSHPKTTRESEVRAWELGFLSFFVFKSDNGE